jgi:hypothetical protein
MIIQKKRMILSNNTIGMKGYQALKGSILQMNEELEIINSK